VSVAFSAVVLTLAWFTAINVGASVAVWLLARRTASFAEGRASTLEHLLLLRFVPSALALGISLLLFLPAHVWLEPRDVHERFPALAYAFAAFALVLFVRSGWRLSRIARTGQFLRVHAGRLVPIVRDGSVRALEVPSFSGISLAGIVRTHVLVGQEARQALTDAELDVAIAHELAHRRAKDNLTRLAMWCVPDVFGVTRLSRQLEAAWRAEAECRADAAAVNGDESRAATLASALVKVARLSRAAVPQSPAWSTFHEPRLLEIRVKRLVANTIPAGASRALPLAPLVAGAICFTCAWILGWPAYLHEATELLLRQLP
jgi:Zn-dependent protease with chaperone function